MKPQARGARTRPFSLDLFIVNIAMPDLARDRRRRAFVAGIAVFTAASALCGVAPSVEALVGARMLQAVGAALLMPASLALLLPAFPPEKRPIAIGVWAAASASGRCSRRSPAPPPARFRRRGSRRAPASTPPPRQLGAVLGVAVAVAVALIGEPAPAELLAAFRDGWWFQAIAGLAAAAAAFAIGPIALPAAGSQTADVAQPAEAAG